MNAPLVSVCLPNLNTLPYLRERVDTIFGQTYPNWEMVVSDNHSDDGAWEFFTELARTDRRVKIQQAPREGLYANWNNCIRRAQGKYVYIATSDDTMALDCLEQLVDALEQHESCGMAHCTLRTIDETGEPVTDMPDDTVFAQGLPGIRGQRHLRRAPYDGLLHLTGHMVYRSITELLIRRSLFDRIGGFESRWGSIGDLNWEMKASLVADVIHVPDTWGSWRVHRRQATAAVDFLSVGHAVKVREMIEDAVEKAAPWLAPDVLSAIRGYWLPWSAEMRTYYRELRDRKQAVLRRTFQVSELFRRNAVRAEMLGIVLGRPKWTDRVSQEIREWLEDNGFGPVISPASAELGYSVR